jgi:hypothetical protein
MARVRLNEKQLEQIELRFSLGKIKRVEGIQEKMANHQKEPSNTFKGFNGFTLSLTCPSQFLSNNSMKT